MPARFREASHPARVRPPGQMGLPPVASRGVRARISKRYASPLPKARNPKTRKRYSMVGHRSAGSALLRTLIVLVVLAAAVLLAATFWPGRPPRIAIRPALPGIGKSTPVLVTLDDTGQVEKVTVEVVQGMDVKPVAEKSFATHPRWAFWKAAAPARLELQIGRDTVSGLRSGKATIRVTAQRSGSLVRRPDPVVATLDLPVRLTPPSRAVLSGFHYVAQGGCQAAGYPGG